MIDFFGIVIMLYLIIFSLFLNHKIEKTWISPIFLINAWVGIFIWADAVYTVLAKNFGPGETDRYLLMPNEVGISLLVWSLGMMSFYVFYFIVRNKKVSRSEKNNLFYGMKLINFDIARMILILSIIISLSALFYLIISALTSGYTLLEVTQLRNQWFSDGGGILLAIIRTFNYGILIYILSSVINKKKNWKIIFILILMVLAVDLFLGTRSNFLYGFLLPLFIIIHRYYKKINLFKLALAAIVLLLTLGVGYRSIARDQFFRANTNRSLMEVMGENFTSIPHFFWGGFEASSLDGLIDILRKYSNSGDFLQGESIWNGLFSFIPRTLWEDKPVGGANAIYTQKFYPNFYGEIQSEYSVSYIGELFMNFGLVGVFIGFGILGSILAFIYKKCLVNGNNIFAIIFYCIFIARTYSLLRGDIYNFNGQLFISLLNLVILFIIYKLSQEIIFKKNRTKINRELRLKKN